MQKGLIEQRKFGDVIRSFRNRRTLSQEALAERADLHRTYLGGVERGERNPTYLIISRLLKALEITWEDFGKALDNSLKE
jgi:transcriptional regulator with XRE-family HTH domain